MNFLRTALGVMTAAAWAIGCGSIAAAPPSIDPGGPEIPGSSADAGQAGDATTTPLDGAPYSYDPPYDASVPSVDDGVFMAVQGAPPPENGRPDPFILIGCPVGGFAELRVYLLAETSQGVLSPREVSRMTARYELTGTTAHVTQNGIDIEVPEVSSLSLTPLEFVTTVTSNPSLVVTSDHSFVTRMVNPSDPTTDTDLGAFTQKLVSCPSR